MSHNSAPPPNGLANVLMLVGFALLVVGGISAYPAIRDWLGLEATPASFGDEAALSKSIVAASESLPRSTPRPTAAPDPNTAPAPIVLPETPLESEVQPTLAASASLSASPSAPSVEASPTAPPVEPTSAPTSSAGPTPLADPTATPQTAGFEPGAPTRLVIPAIDLDAPVETVGWSLVNSGGQPVSMWNVPNRRAAGWLKTSARAGERGNTVLDGHHNIDGEVFRDLVSLNQGDTIQLWVGDQMREYVVSLRKILPEKGQPLEVRLDNAKWIQRTDDERVTLITCWPYTNNTHRLVVVALPADASPATVPSADGVP